MLPLFCAFSAQCVHCVWCGPRPPGSHRKYASAAAAAGMRHSMQAWLEAPGQGSNQSWEPQTRGQQARRTLTAEDCVVAEPHAEATSTSSLTMPATKKYGPFSTCGPGRRAWHGGVDVRRSRGVGPGSAASDPGMAVPRAVRRECRALKVFYWGEPSGLPVHTKISPTLFLSAIAALDSCRRISKCSTVLH